MILFNVFLYACNHFLSSHSVTDKNGKLSSMQVFPENLCSKVSILLLQFCTMRFDSSNKGLQIYMNNFRHQKPKA